MAALKAPRSVARQSTRLVGKCKFKLAHVDASDNTLVFDARRAKWTMEVDTREKLVIAINLELKSNATLSTESMGRIPHQFKPIVSQH